MISDMSLSYFKSIQVTAYIGLLDKKNLKPQCILTDDA